MPRAFEPKARLGWQQEDGGFDYNRSDGPNRRAADALVSHLAELHHTEDIDGAQIRAFVMLAESVDSDPTNAALWGQYRAAELQLRGVTDRGKESAFDALLKGLAESGPVVSDAKVTEPPDPRAASRKGVVSARPTADVPSAPRGRRRGGDPS